MLSIKRTYTIFILCAASVLIIAYAPFWGSKTFSWMDIFSKDVNIRDVQIFWQMRIPRALVAFLAGGAFALGVSAGASFGATVYIWLGCSFVFWGISGISLFSFVGAVLAIAIVWSLSKIRYGNSTTKMLLAGVIVSFFFISLIMLLQFLSGIYESFRISRWLMGSLSVFGYEPFFEVLPFVAVALAVIFYFSRELNLLTTGEEIAISRGVDTRKLVKILLDRKS